MAPTLSRRRLLVVLSLIVPAVFLYLFSSRAEEPGRVQGLHHTQSLGHNTAILQDTLHVQSDGNSSPRSNEASATLSVFSHIFVISRPIRLDRRATMEQLRAALGLEWTYVDAISSDDPLVDEIGECLRLSRKHKHPRTFQWPSRSDVNHITTSSFTLPSNVSESWLYPTVSTPCLYPAPPPNTPAQISKSADVPLLRDPPTAVPFSDLQSLATSLPSVPLTCAIQDRSYGVKYKPSILSYMLLTPAKFACWYSHLDAIQRIAALGEPLVGVDHRGAHGAALVLEDDVDMERDIGARLREAWTVLPDDWDIVFLGHCWSNEARYSALRPRGQSKASGLYPKMSVHPSVAPKCTHAYALSRAGARRILLHLLHPSFAYSRALDQAFAWLVQSGRLRAFSIVPSLVVQHKLTGSDIDGGEIGMGSGWKDSLDHGFFQA